MALSLVLLLSTFPAVRSNTIEFTDSTPAREIRWRNSTIEVAFSTSLQFPGPNIKPGSDVVGAARRALSRWSRVAKIKFVETSSTARSISPGDNGDGVNLITVADTAENRSIFSGGSMTGKTRIFYDNPTGSIMEADVVINPYPTSEDGTPSQFSTDGTPGTYDLESTFTHELGHLLGLDHSSVIGSTMHARQALNGTYKLNAFTERTLSESDRAAVSSIYGGEDERGEIQGKLVKNSPGTDATPLVGALVWVENSVTGRVIASTVTSSGGNYKIESIPAGTYRVVTEYLSRQTALLSANIKSQNAFRTAELAKQLRVYGDEVTNYSFALPTQTSPPVLMARVLGTNGELSTTPLPADAGNTLKVFVGGEGVDQVPATGISVTSPFIMVDPQSLSLEQFGTTFPVISFNVAVAANAPFGDYSLRLQLNSGEVAYVPGGITVDPGVNSSYANPADDLRFFVTQHYRDLLGREPDEAGLKYWLGRLEECQSDLECLRVRRTEVSAAFFMEPQFQDTGSFLYRLYQAALGREPTFAEFMRDGNQLQSKTGDLETRKRLLSAAIVERPEFLQRYSRTLTSVQFMSALLSDVARASGVDLSSERISLVTQDDGTTMDRATVIHSVADNPSFVKTQATPAVVLLYYFGYLRRAPDEGSHSFWLNTLNSLDPAHRTAPALVCAFINSDEYQARFGMHKTHTDKECGGAAPR